MDPSLEHPALWPGVHKGLIAVRQFFLAPQPRPRYYGALEERMEVTEPEQRRFIARPDVCVWPQRWPPESMVPMADLWDWRWRAQRRHRDHGWQLRVRLEPDPLGVERVASEPRRGPDGAWPR